MLRSDALPTRALPTTDAPMLIRTDEGPTFVHFKTTTHSSADSDGCSIAPAGAASPALGWLLIGMALLAARATLAARQR